VNLIATKVAFRNKGYGTNILAPGK
jgi:predicted GNAT family acetyltransferase